MSTLALNISSVCIGLIVSWAYASREVRKAKAEAVRLLLAQQADLTVEDYARQVGA